MGDGIEAKSGCDIDRVLRERFGFAEFRAGQREVVEALLAGRPALAIFPTGGGKSLCYQLPAVAGGDGLTLVVSPLIALMKDQVDSMARKGIACARLDSSLGPDAMSETCRRAEAGELRMLFVAPERFANERFLAWLKRVRIGLFAIDEAHCISEWGHNFRPDYLKLAQIAKRLRLQPVLALTATATENVARDIRKAFGIAKGDHIRTGYFRPNLIYRVTPCAPGERDGRLVEAIRAEPDVPTIVYVTLQRTAEDVAGLLQREGFRAQAYHAGMGSDARHAAQEKFMRGDVPVVVATIAFGMGIDKADIRRIIHYNLPGSIENYVQETGRAGRDGGRSECRLLACASDRLVLENFVHGDVPDDGALRKLVFHILDQTGTFDLSLYDLSMAHDIRSHVIATVLAYLELDGLLASTGTTYAAYKVALLEPEAQILRGYDARRRKFLETLFAHAKKARKWWTIDPAAIAEDSGLSREKIVAAIGHLEAAGEIETQPSRVLNGFRRTAGDEPKGDVLQRLREAFRARGERDLQRVGHVVELAFSGRCIPRQLVAYFGEQMDGDCGECSVCRGESNHGALADPTFRGIAMDEIRMMQELRGERDPALRSPRQLARFLCGISSPAALRERLTRDPRFGALAAVPFGDVLVQIESMG